MGDMASSGRRAASLAARRLRLVTAFGAALAVSLLPGFASEAQTSAESAVVALSASRDGRVPGLAFADEDIIAYNMETTTWSLLFDGSDIGLSRTNIDAFELLALQPTAVIDLSFTTSITLPGSVVADPADVVRFVGEAGHVTRGTLSLLVDGSAIELGPRRENVDALAYTDSGVALSTGARLLTGGLSGSGEDLVLFEPDRIGSATSGSLSKLFDGSQSGLRRNSLAASWIDRSTGEIYAAATGRWRTIRPPIDGNDVFVVRPGDTRVRLFFNAAEAGFAGQIDGLHIMPFRSAANLAPVLTTPSTIGLPENDLVVLDLAASDDRDAEGRGLRYAVTGGVDASHFTVHPLSGVLSFVAAPDFESPRDRGRDNNYDVEVAAIDSAGLASAVALTISVADVPEFWPRQIGGPGDDLGQAVVVDSDDSIYMAGTFRDSADLDPGSRTQIRTSAGESDAYITKLSAEGELVWLRVFSGAGVDLVTDLALAADGGLHFSGYFSESMAISGTVDPVVLTAEGLSDAFVGKFDTQGDIMWIQSFGGPGADRSSGVSVGPAGEVFVAGSNGNSDVFAISGEEFEVMPYGGFVLRLDIDGELLSSLALGPSGDFGTSAVRGLAVDTEGNTYFTGYFVGPLGQDSGVHLLEDLSADGSGLVGKIGEEGAIEWLAAFSGGRIAGGVDVAIAPDGSPVFTGFFRDQIDIDPGPGVEYLAANARKSDVYIVKLTTDGALIWGRNFGGESFNGGVDIAIDGFGNSYTTGHFTAPRRPPLASVLGLVNRGESDAFVVKHNAFGELVWAGGIGGARSDGGTGIAVNRSGHAYVTGYSSGLVDFDPGASERNQRGIGGTDAFLVKLQPNGDLD